MRRPGPPSGVSWTSSREGGGEGRTSEWVCTPEACTAEMTSSTALRRRRWRILRVLDMRQGIFLSTGRARRAGEGQRRRRGVAGRRAPKEADRGRRRGAEGAQHGRGGGERSWREEEARGR